jgi:predicted ATP-dependent protease
VAGLIREAVRYTGDQETLPLCPLWIGKQLREVGVISGNGAFTGEQLTQMLAQREWRKAILLTVCRMKFCWNKFWWKPKANASGRSTPCR